MLKKAFTLVEIIVVITVISILGTIGFLGYSGYIEGVKDTNRVNQVQSIADGIDLYLSKGNNLKPEKPIEINVKGSGSTLFKKYSTQGYAGKTILEKINYSSDGVDPTDKDYFIYSLKANNKDVEIMALLENSENSPEQFLSSGVTDPNNRIPFVYGKARVGVFLDSNNVPLNKTVTGSINIDCNSSNPGIKLLLDNGEILDPITDQNLYKNAPCYSKPANGCSVQPVYSNASFTIGSATLPNQPWIKGDTNQPCSYECLNNYTGIYCQTPPNYKCATNPGYVNASYTVGSPVGDNVSWQAGSSVAPCYYECINGYSGATCNIAPVSNSCSIQPTYLHAVYTAGTPTTTNQARQNAIPTDPCYYECTGGYTGSSCSNAPAAFPTTLEEALVNFCLLPQVDFDANFVVATGVYNGDIDCSNKGLTNAHMNVFFDLKRVNGYFNLNYNHLTSLDGLSSLESVTGLFSFITNNISDISGISGMSTVYQIDGSNNNISDITPLTTLTSLTSLTLSNNTIADISPLSGFNGLTDLILDNNNIVSITPIVNINSLTRLVLNNNGIVTLPDNFSDLTNLVELDMLINPLLGSLAFNFDKDSSSLTENGITISGDNVTIVGNGTEIDITVTSGVSINTFEDVLVQKCGITQLEYDTNFNEITGHYTGTINCINKNLVDDDLDKFTPLVSISGDLLLGGPAVSVDRNIFIDSDGLVNLTSVGNKLSLRYTNLVDVSSLSNLNNVLQLDLAVNDITDITSISGLTTLEYLTLEYNGGTSPGSCGGIDINPVGTLINLKTLILNCNDVSDITMLTNLTSLERFDATFNPITEISSLSGATNLRTLIIRDTEVTDLSPVVNFPNLEGLHVDGSTNITDISPVVSLLNIGYLSIYDTSITDISSLDTYSSTDTSSYINFDNSVYTTKLDAGSPICLGYYDGTTGSYRVRFDDGTYTDNLGSKKNYVCN